MKKIPLTRGYFAIVDDEDFEYLNQWKWLYSNGYAARSQHVSFKDGVQVSKNIQMHRVILNTPDGLLVDHKNNNGLDNRKNNIRNCTYAENARNQKLSKRSSTGFKGVSWKKSHEKFCANIKIGKKQIHLGLFACKIEAARAYNEAALKYHGEFACLNPIPQ